MKLTSTVQKALVHYVRWLGTPVLNVCDAKTLTFLTAHEFIVKQSDRGHMLTPEGEKIALPFVLAKAEKLIEHASGWKGRCFEIASTFIAKKLVPGVAVYGHFRGDIAEHTHFRKKGRPQSPFVQHGWVLLPDGRIFDPTRWVFEGYQPYLFIGQVEHEDYDEGGNRIRTMMRPDPPSFDYDSDRIYHLSKEEAPTDVFVFVEKTLCLFREFGNDEYEPGMVTLEQLNWLGGRDPKWLGANVVGVYRMLARLDLLATIPIDNLAKVQRESGIDFKQYQPSKARLG